MDILLALLISFTAADYCDKDFNPYAEFNSACYEEIIPQWRQELPWTDSDAPLPFARYFTGFGYEVESITEDKDLIVEHYKACRSYVGDLLNQK